MADGKFYWLKLKRDFFKRHDIRIIEGMPNGKDYVLFYLKLLCESVDHEGNLRFSEQIPYNEQMLSTITDTNVDIVRNAINIFTELGMMELMDDGTFYMNEVQKMMGSAVDNDNANRQRRFRERQKELALPERYTSVTKNNESKSKSIEKEIELDIKERNIKKEKTTEIDERTLEIVNYLNEKAGTKYRAKTEDTRKHIRARLSEGFTVEDFKTVIDKKVKEWKGTRMEEYLRPMTLFSTKFESYLNATVGSDIGDTGKRLRERTDEDDELYDVFGR